MIDRLSDRIKRSATVDDLRVLVEADVGPPRGSSRRYCCPKHDGKDPNFGVYENSRGVATWRCWSQCDESGNIVDYMLHVRGVSWDDALTELCDLLGIDRGRNPSLAPARRASKPKISTPQKKAPVDWPARLAALDVTDDLTELLWLPGWLRKRRLTLQTLETARVLACWNCELPVKDSDNRRTGEVRIVPSPDGLLMFPAYDLSGSIKGWQTRDRQAQRFTAQNSAVKFCGGGPTEWWPHLERVTVIASPTDRLSLIASGRGHNPILAPFGDYGLRPAVKAATRVWPDQQVVVIADSDAHQKALEAVQEAARDDPHVQVFGCLGDDVGKMWEKNGSAKELVHGMVKLR